MGISRRDPYFRNTWLKELSKDDWISYSFYSSNLNLLEDALRTRDWTSTIRLAVAVEILIDAVVLEFVLNTIWNRTCTHKTFPASPVQSRACRSCVRINWRRVTYAADAGRHCPLAPPSLIRSKEWPASYLKDIQACVVEREQQCPRPLLSEELDVKLQEVELADPNAPIESYSKVTTVPRSL
jgi:hypothetical protein